MIPHASVHGRSEKQRLFGAFFHIPRSDDAGEQIVAYSASQLGQGVGVERGDEHRVRPFAQFDVEDGIAALAPTRPFVLVGQDAFEARMSLDGGEIEEVRRAFRRHQPDRQLEASASRRFRDLVDEQRDFEGCHAAGTADQQIKVRFHAFCRSRRGEQSSISLGVSSPVIVSYSDILIQLYHQSGREVKPSSKVTKYFDIN